MALLHSSRFCGQSSSFMTGMDFRMVFVTKCLDAHYCLQVIWSGLSDTAVYLESPV